MRRRALEFAQKALYWSGLVHLWSHTESSGSVALLMYHSVADARADRWIAPRNRIEPWRFERQMRFLARRRNVIGLGALVERLKCGVALPRQATVLSFDDGYRDNLDVAAPILARYGLSATLHLCTGLVGRGENQWADRLYVAVRYRTRDRFIVAGGKSVDLRDPSACAHWHREVHDRLLGARADERARLLNEIEDALRPPAHAPRLTFVWEEVRELARRYPRFELGIHGSEHLDLTGIPEDEAIGDIERSVHEFEDALGRRPEHFSFPYSRSTPGVSAHLADLGLSSAYTGSGFGDGEKLDCFNLLRQEAPRSGTFLRLWTSGAHPGLSLALFGRA